MNAKRVTAAAFLILLTACSTNMEVAVGELPTAVRAAIDQRFPDAQYLEADRLTDRRGTKYDVEIRGGSKRYEIEVREDGTIVDIDRDFG